MNSILTLSTLALGLVATTVPISAEASHEQPARIVYVYRESQGPKLPETFYLSQPGQPVKRYRRIVVSPKKETAPVTYQPKPTIKEPTYANTYEGEIARQCAIYGCNTAQVTRVMYCESRGNPNAKNPSSDASGLMQFMPGTFYGYAKQAGVSNANIWNPNQQIQVAAYMFANGQARQWVCK